MEAKPQSSSGNELRSNAPNVVVRASPVLSVMFQLSNHLSAMDPRPGRSTLLDGEGYRGGQQLVLPCSKDAWNQKGDQMSTAKETGYRADQGRSGAEKQHARSIHRWERPFLFN